MPDRDELIASLKGRIWGGVIHKGGYIHVPQEEAEAILELLKGQEAVVRCKDCRWWEDGRCENDYVHQQIYDDGCYPDFHTDSEWFCAEGERR